MITGLASPTAYAGSFATAKLQNAGFANKINTSIERLGSGYRVNSAKDDAAAMAVGARLNTETAALRMVTQNITDTVSRLQIIDGVMARQQENFTRMKALTVQAGSDNLSDTERAMLDVEYQALLEENCRMVHDGQMDGRYFMGESCVPDIPFSDFFMQFRMSVTSASIYADDADGGASGNGNGFVDATEFVEIDVGLTNSLGVAITGITMSNPQVSDLSIADGPTADGGFVLSNSLSIATLAAGSSAQTTSGQDLDLLFAAGSDGASFDISVDLEYTIGAETSNVRVVFGSATVGSITDGTSMPLKEIIDLSDPDPDLVIDTRVGSGILTDEDLIALTLPDITNDNLNTALYGSDITTKDNADTMSSVLDSTLDTLIEHRATVGAAVSRFRQAAHNVQSSIQNMSHAAAKYLSANIAEEVGNLSRAQAHMIVALDTVSRWDSGRVDRVESLLDQKI